MPTYQQNKKSIYKWRENNLDSFRAYNNEYCRKYNAANREKLNKMNKGTYHYKKECKIFRNILLEY
jgi:hypothetical protein